MTERGQLEIIDEARFVDQWLLDFLREVKEYETLLNELETTLEERTTIMEALDEGWPFTQCPVRVTGRLTTIVSQEKCDGETEVSNTLLDNSRVHYAQQTVFVEDKQLISLGFQIFADPVTIDDEVVAERLRIGYFFWCDDEVLENAPLWQRRLFIYGFALPEDMLIDLPIYSQEHVVGVMNYDFPVIAETIDGIVLDQKIGGDECQASLALKDVVIPFDSRHDTLEQLNIIATYLDMIVDFEDTPYIFGPQHGAFYFTSRDGNILLDQAVAFRDAQNFLGVPQGFTLLPRSKIESGAVCQDATQRIFGLRLAVDPNDRLTANSEDDIVVPLEMLCTMRSGRRYLLEAIGHAGCLMSL